ncbi:hypothetical protein HBI71_169110 [Parastagonospora nodorum]|nr:hypothetical protein HBI71_169110 [Parastagonospora nodorum]
MTRRTRRQRQQRTLTRDGLSARVGTAMEHCTLEEWTLAAVFFGLTDAYIFYFKELLSDNSGIFANAMGMGKTRAMVLAVLMGHVHFKNWTEVQNARAEGDAIEHNAVDDDDKLSTIMTGWGRAANAWKNEVVAMDLANSTWCDLSDLLALQFCFFSDSPPENMGRLTKEEAMKMRIDTTDAISKALAAANKLVALRSYVLGGVDYRETVYWIILEANTPAVHSEATKHCLALSAAQFVIVCGFGKVDKHMFRAYNTMSVTAQRTIIRKGGFYGRTVFDEFYNCKLEGIIMAKKGVSNWFNATDKRDSVTGDRIYKMEDAVYWSIAETLSYRTSKQWRNMIANVKHDASEYESSYEYKELISQGVVVAQRFMLKRILKTRDLDILEKEGLDELEASRRVIFNRFKMQAIFKIYGSCKVKRFTLNSVKDLFTNLSKDYFLVREARAITKSSLNWIWSIAAEDAAKAANTLLLLKEVCAKILIGSYKLIVQAVTWLGLREKFSDESVLVMQGGMTQHEINLKLAKWRDLDGPWIMVALMAFAEAITLTEATHVLAEMCVGIVYFNLDSELELKVLGKQDVKTTS